MKKILGIAALFLLVAAVGFASGGQWSAGVLHVVGDVQTYNNDVFSDYNTAIAEQPTIRLDGSAGALLLGAGDSTAPTWTIVYSAANTATMGDSDLLGFGAAAADGTIGSDGTNVDFTVTALLTVGDGGTTNYTSFSATGAQIWVGSAQATLNDNVELNFGTSAGESTIASNGTDTTWTVTSGDLVLGTDGKLTRIEGAMQLGAVSTFTDSDGTPDVTGNTYWNTNTTAFTITDFDGAGIESGQFLFVISKGAITYDVTTSGLKGGTTDIVTASGDITCWLYDGTDWYLISFTDMSDNLS